MRSGAGLRAGRPKSVRRRRRKRHARGRPDPRLGGRRARAERTSNMYHMFVTLEVSMLTGWLNADAEENMKPISVTPEVFQLDMSALKSPKPEKSWCMLVIAETPQLEMGP